MKFLSVHEFSDLSDTEKKEYLEELRYEKNNVFTAEEYQLLAMEVEKLNYADSSEIANELYKQAEIQREADRMYNAEKRKRGFVVILAVLCGAFFAVSVGIIISMFL